MLARPPGSVREYSNLGASSLRAWITGSVCTSVLLPRGLLLGTEETKAHSLATHMLWDLCLSPQGQADPHTHTGSITQWGAML